MTNRDMMRIAMEQSAEDLPERESAVLLLRMVQHSLGQERDQERVHSLVG